MAEEHTYAQIRGALSACNALIVGAKSNAERRHWGKMEKHWQRKLEELEKPDVQDPEVRNSPAIVLRPV